jgi:predicted dienelactone hydrolase
VFLCEALARAGWIVAAPDHTNEVSAVRLRSRPAQIPIRFAMFASSVWNTLVKGTGPALKRLGHRTRQLRDVIDACLRPGGRAPFSIDRVDTGRIGVIGHSFGGWTALLTAGAVDTEAHPTIRAAVALSAPVARNIFTPAEIASIRVPVMFQAGTHEWPLEQYKRVHFDPCPPPKYLVQIAGADHRSFTCGFDTDFPSVSRLLEDPVRAAVTATAIDFLSAYLKDDAAAGRRLRCYDYPGVHRMLRDGGDL